MLRQRLATAFGRLPRVQVARMGPAMGLPRFYSDGPPPLTREFVQQRIMDVLSNCDKVDATKLAPQASFEELGLDSLDVVDALFYIEEEFFVEMPDHEANDIKTVGQAVDYILKQPDAY